MSHISSTFSMIRSYAGASHLTKIHLQMDRNERNVQEDVSGCIESLLIEVEEVEINKKQTNTNGSSLFICEYCGVSYALSQSLKWHHSKYHKNEKDRVHTGGKLLACKFCDTTHSTSDSLYMHCLRNHKQGYKTVERKKDTSEDVSLSESKLSLSSANVSDASKTVEHSNDKQGSEQFICKFCGMAYSIFGSLKSHYIRKQCHASKNTKNSTADHSIDETTATDCNDTFDAESETEEFVVDNHSSGSEQFACEFCDKVYSRAGSLNMHCRRKHTQAYLGSENSPSGGSPSRSIRCQYCPVKVGSASGLSSHMRSKHPNMLNQKPERLGNSRERTIQASPATSGSARLKERAARVKQSPEKRKSVHQNSLKCDKCDREFASAEFLAKHKLTHSSAKASITCYHCGELFNQFGLLKQHLEAKECGSENDEPSVFDYTEERQVQTNRKRKYENKENNKENRTLTQIVGDLSTPTAKKIKTEPDVIILEPHIAVDDPFEIKLERDTRYEVSPTNLRPNMIVAQSYSDNQEQNRPLSVAESIFTPPMPPRSSSFTARRELNESVSNGNSTNTETVLLVSQTPNSFVSVNQDDYSSKLYAQSPLPPIHSSPSIGSDFSSISQHQTAYNVPSLNNSVADSLIEKSPLPLSTGIFTRAAQFANELMIVWSYFLEEDMLAAVNKII